MDPVNQDTKSNYSVSLCMKSNNFVLSQNFSLKVTNIVICLHCTVTTPFRKTEILPALLK